MAETNALASGVSRASTETRHVGNDEESSTDDGSVTPTPESDDESTGFSEHQLLDTVMNLTGSETETDANQCASLPASSVSRFARQEPDSSSSSGESCRERGARAQQFIAYQLTGSQAKILKLKKVQKKVMGDLRSSSTCFKFDKSDQTFLVKQAFESRLEKVLNQKIRTEQFHVQGGDDPELGIISSLTTEELQHEMVMDFDDETLTLVYHVSTESKISESLKRLRTPHIEIRLPFSVGRFLEARDNLQRFIEAFHHKLGFQVLMEFHKDQKNRPFLRVTCNRDDRQAAFPKVEQYIAAVEQSDLKISLAKGLYLQSLPGQQELQAIARRHHCLVTVETPAQRVLLRALHRNDVLLVCEGNLACCCPQVFIVPLCEGQTEWSPLYKHIMERALLSSDAGKYADLFGSPSTPWTHPITYGRGSHRRTIVIMYFPKPTNEDDFQRQLQESCKAAMQSAIDVFPEAEIILPITLGDTVSLQCCTLPLMMAVIETIRENVGSALYVKLFFDKSHQNVPETVAHMERRLIGFGWSLDKYLENTNSENVAAVSSKGRGDLDGATVRLVGLKQDVANSTDEMIAMDIPPVYEVRAEEFKTTYSRAVADSSSKVIPRRTIPKSDASTTSTVQHSLQEPAVSADTSVGSNQQRSENQGSSQTSTPPAVADDTPLPQPQACVAKEEVFMRYLDSTTVKALKILMKKDFSQVQVNQTTIEQVTLRCAAQDTMNKIDLLRREEMTLGPEDLQKISAPMDITEEGVAAYVVPVPHQGKVIIFSFDYNAVSNAKHLLNVKLGKVNVPARQKRPIPFEDTVNISNCDGPNSQVPYTSPTAKTAKFFTKSGLKVSVKKTDITKLPVDAIVNAANEHLAHGGSVAYTIAKAAGFQLEDECKEYIKQNGTLKVREVVATTAGSLPCKKVMHAVGPRWSDYKDKALCRQHLVDTVYNCLHKANTMQLTSLAITSISSDVFGVPGDMCAASYLSAVQSFDEEFGGNTSVRHVHFVDVNDDMINVIQQTFTQQWNIDMAPKGPEVGKRGAFATAQQVFMSFVTGGRSTGHTGSKVAPARSENDLSLGKNCLHPDEKSAVYNVEVGEIEFCYHFQDLDVLLICQNVTDAWTDALVLWQETGNIARDENFRQYKELLRPAAQKILSGATYDMKSAGRVLHIKLDERVVLFPVVSSHSVIAADTVQQMVERCLNKADSSNKAAVAIPTHPRTLKDSKESNLAVTSFAMGVYRAVKTFSERHKSVKQIHIISPDLETITCINDTVSQEIAMEKSLHGTRPFAGVSNHCGICPDTMIEPKILECGHSFCKKCVNRWLSEKSCCPTCKKVHGTLIGNQPSDGRMEMKSSPSDVSGYEGCGSLVIEYSFKDGMQTDRHPEPGERYSGTSRTAYLPNTREGRTVLMLLMTAFYRCLIFTVEKSPTTGRVVIKWNVIHHKTSMSGGAKVHGYPDPTYLTRVTQELANKGVTEEDLPDTQKDFIENPERFIRRGSLDFSYHFRVPGSTWHD